MSGFGWVRRLVVLGFSVFAAVAFSASALATATNGYTASISTSDTVRAGDTTPGVTVYVKITNTSTGSGAYKVGSADAVFPPGFALTAASIATDATTGGANWRASISVDANSGNSTLRIRTTETSSNYLPACTTAPCKFVTAKVQLTSAPTTPGVKTVVTDAKTDGDHDGDGVLVPRSGPDPTVTVMPGPLASFSVRVDNQIDQGSGLPVKDQVAGTAFTLQATAFDKYGNVKTDYAGSNAVLGGNLDSSPSAPSGESTAPVYGAGGNKALAWGVGTGVGTAPVTAKKAVQTLRALTVTDGVVGTSDTFTVKPAAFALSFTAQPAEALVGTAVPSTPPGGIKVSASDPWGNTPSEPGSPASTVTVTAKSVTTGLDVAFSSGTSSKQPAAGLATFGDLTLAVPDLYVLQARLVADGQDVSGTSAQFRVIAPGTPCAGTSCSSQAGNDKQGALSNLTTSQGSLSGLFLNTAVGVSATPGCAGFTLLPGTTFTDVTIYGNVSIAKPTNIVTLYIPKATIQQAGYTSRSAQSFDACLGNKNFTYGPTGTDGLGWTTKSGALATVTDGRFWGLVPGCSKALDPTNPCVLLKTKEKDDLAEVIGRAAVTALGFKNSDVAIVVREPYPWDGLWGCC
jgi:hypothetical protein